MFKKNQATQKEIQTLKLVHYCEGNSVIAVFFFFLPLSLLIKFLDRTLRALSASEERGMQIIIFKAVRVHINKSLHYLSSEYP